MKKFAFFASAILLVLVSASAFAMTGTLVNGEPAYNEVEFTTFDASTNLHDETVDNPYNWYKGWWYVNLTNKTSRAWSSVTINPGAGNLVAIVQGNGLVDEWGFIGNSVLANKAGTMEYTNTLGSRTYENGAFGLLWRQAKFTFTTPLAVGQKIGFKIYTDNSYYEGPYASSFCMCLTPTAVTPVPEPSSLLALFGGVAALAGLARRKR